MGKIVKDGIVYAGGGGGGSSTGISSITYENGYLVFTFTDETVQRVAMPTASMVSGYYYNGQFYQDAAHTIPLAPTNGQLYADTSDAEKPVLYCYNGTAFVPIGNSVWGHI